MLINSYLKNSVCMHAKSLKPRPTLWDSVECGPPGSFVHVCGILRQESSSRRTFPIQESNPGFLLGRWILYHWATWEAPPKKNRNLLRVLRDFGRWQRSRCTRNTSLSKDTSGIHLQTQKCMQNTSWEQTGVPAQQKRICRRTQNLVGWRN